MVLTSFSVFGVSPEEGNGCKPVREGLEVALLGPATRAQEGHRLVIDAGCHCVVHFSCWPRAPKLKDYLRGERWVTGKMVRQGIRKHDNAIVMVTPEEEFKNVTFYIGLVLFKSLSKEFLHFPQSSCHI